MIIAYILIMILYVSIAYDFNQLSKTKDRLEVLERQNRVYEKELIELKKHNEYLTDANSMLRSDILRLEEQYEYLNHQFNESMK